MIVDITPEELLTRLKEGKVYLQEMAERAVKRYFTLNNLIALREMSFRRLALHLGQDIQTYKKALNIQKSWAVGKTVMVCLSHKPITYELLMQGEKLAKQNMARKVAVYVVRPKKIRDKNEKRQVKMFRQIAHTLGYEVHRLTAVNMAKALAFFAKNHNVSDILIGKSKRAKLIERLFGSVVYDLLSYTDGINVQIIADEKKRRKKKIKQKIIENQSKKDIFLEYIKSAMIVLFATFVAISSEQVFGSATQAMILLLSVLWCAARYRFYPSIFANILSFICYMYVFTNPKFSFSISSLTQSVAFGAFIVVSLTVSQLTSRLRFSFDELKNREIELSKLYEFSALISKVYSFQEFRKIILDHLTFHFRLPFVILVSDYKLNELDAPFPQNPRFSSKELAAAKWSFLHKTPSGYQTETFAGLNWTFVPMQASDEYVGVMAIFTKDNEAFLQADQQYLFKMMLTQIAYRLTIYLADLKAQKQKTQEEKAHLQKLLLSSVTHDFKTPLASIMGVISSLKAYGSMFDKKKRLEMLNVAYEESERLNNYIDKVMQLVQVDHQKMQLSFEDVLIDELIKDVIEQMKKYYPKREIIFETQLNKTKVELDPIFIRQVLINLIENAFKYSKEDTTVKIMLALLYDHVEVCVLDQGKGLPEDALAKVFDLFYRFEKEDYAPEGHGLGLAICKGIIKAHHGIIEAKNRKDEQGCCFRFKLPIKQVNQLSYLNR